MTVVLDFPAARIVVGSAGGALSRRELRALLTRTLDDDLLAQLDAMDGDPDGEPGGDDEPSLAAPIGGDSQVPWCAGGSQDLEQALGRLGRCCLTLPSSNDAP